MSTDLIAEIRRARENLRHQEAKAAEAGFTLRMCKEAEKKARAELDTLLDELETGQSRYPLPGFDRFDLLGDNGTLPPGPAICGAIEWTTVDLNRHIEAACLARPKGMTEDPYEPWQALHDHGCDDAKILEVLRSIWRPKPSFDRDGEADKVGRTVRGGATPAIWIGMRATIDQKPTLEGLELAARVRAVLELPRVPEAPAEGPAAPVPPAAAAAPARTAAAKGGKAAKVNNRP